MSKQKATTQSKRPFAKFHCDDNDVFQLPSTAFTVAEYLQSRFE